VPNDETDLPVRAILGDFAESLAARRFRFRERAKGRPCNRFSSFIYTAVPLDSH